ncbi:hypothetical protein [Tissierella praeacuta]|uniref:PDC sensor domain-containing protein n=1 Tax=Tissierella praeacuta TaxID=43131 RepID=UPI003341DE6C
MKKISTRIVLTVLSCAIAMSLVVGVTSIIRSMDVIEKKVKLSQLPTGFTSKDENNPKFAWYFDCIKSVKGLWSDMYVSNANLNVITYSAPIVVDNIPIGAIGVDLSVEDVVNNIKSIKLYDTGYAFLLNKDYYYLIHPTLDSTSNLSTIDGEKYGNLI